MMQKGKFKAMTGRGGGEVTRVSACGARGPRFGSLQFVFFKLKGKVASSGLSLSKLELVVVLVKTIIF